MPGGRGTGLLSSRGSERRRRERKRLYNSRQPQTSHQMKSKLRPTKMCPQCGREFCWRKKWERDWPRLIYCSERCRRAKRRD